MMVDSWPSSVSLTFCVAVPFFSFVVALWFLGHSLRYFVVHYQIRIKPCRLCAFITRLVHSGGPNSSFIDLNESTRSCFLRHA
jgi:hypothetical protein